MILASRRISESCLFNTIIFSYFHLTRISALSMLPPGDSLNRALEAFAASISALRADMDGLTPERIAKIERDLNESIKNADNHLTQMENKVLMIETNLSSLLQGTIPNIENNLKKMESKVERLDDKVSEVDVKTGILKTDTGRLDNANKIWRNNFRVVSKTFAALRQTVSLN